MIRAKFRVELKDPGNSGNVTLRPVYSAEDKSFWEATPPEEIQKYITNEKDFEWFELGKEYYVDFTLAEN